jgi:hypothetical protein
VSKINSNVVWVVSASLQAGNVTVKKIVRVEKMNRDV